METALYHPSGPEFGVVPTFLESQWNPADNSSLMCWLGTCLVYILGS